MNLMVCLDFILGVMMQVFNIQTDQTSLITATWDHAVNSKAKLQSALTSESKMIEADVITGHLVDEEGEKTDRIPIMGHPPSITSDLSLKEFLDAWKNSNKILKLDFKSTEAFKLASPVIENAFKDSPPNRLPWLNADILPGPGPGDSPGVDADTFLKVSSKSFPDSILSLGWTTKRNDNDKYSEHYINAMVDVLFKNKYMNPVTYAVRASFAVNSISELQYLLETSPVGSTLTVWCSDSKDIINYPNLVQLINTVGANRVYLDLPDEMSKIFFEMYTSSSVRASNNVGLQSLFLASLFVLKNVFL
ncbi:DHFR-coamplified protein-like precursor [Acyrthosiphon pisum]|uniref:ACYPI000491 protein n=1 Tax=Acyrthosiphon pisum TaxID=7029 RepID=C4WRR8_ACYPI|nr:DHFR-coamplified protein-like precursor [Acyrthosiphon pisum]BAH70588.1 ACYPI000491 [Acyrthosiphon pisum]|eukprot:NP_001155388.1 DHFR-coamplified protein-like precursor [Acyrthosiphon pisum]